MLWAAMPCGLGKSFMIRLLGKSISAIFIAFIPKKERGDCAERFPPYQLDGQP